MIHVKTCAVCGNRKTNQMFSHNRYGGYDRVCRECRKQGCETPPMTEKEHRLAKKAWKYAKEVLYPESGNWHASLSRARNAYGL